MSRSYTNQRYLKALNDRVLIFDGAMGTSLQSMNLSASDFGGELTAGCNDYLVISAPEIVEKVHLQRRFEPAREDLCARSSARRHPGTADHPDDPFHPGGWLQISGRWDRRR